MTIKEVVWGELGNSVWGIRGFALELVMEWCTIKGTGWLR